MGDGDCFNAWDEIVGDRFEPHKGPSPHAELPLSQPEHAGLRPTSRTGPPVQNHEGGGYRVQTDNCFKDCWDEIWFPRGCGRSSDAWSWRGNLSSDPGHVTWGYCGGWTRWNTSPGSRELPRRPESCSRPCEVPVTFGGTITFLTSCLCVAFFFNFSPFYITRVWWHI